MNRSAVLDANFLVAYFDRKDAWHTQAVKFKNRLEKEKIEGVFLDCVINEVTSVLGRRFEEKGEAEKFNHALNSLTELIPLEIITWTYPHVPRLYSQILSLIKRYQGRFNFHDALITLMAKERGIKLIVSFDKDFDNIGWLTRIGK